LQFLQKIDGLNATSDDSNISKTSRKCKKYAKIVAHAAFFMIHTLSPSHFPDYELIDAGNGEKLERFGKYVLIRPEPQALWSPDLPEAEWKKLADARFVQEGSASGDWERNPKNPMPDQWVMGYNHGGMKLRFRLGLTKFKHVGIFPEQAVNWDFVYARCKAMQAPKVLNLFAYTGGASLAAKAAGADVIHCDAIKQVVNWAAANMELSKLDGIRWLVEDAFKFVIREAKRGNKYDGIVLDPPAWGHGPKGEKWKLEEQINELMGLIAKILAPQNSFLVLNAYSLGYSSLILENLGRSHFSDVAAENLQVGELCLTERSGRKLPAGVFMRFFT
jgi:23S rRNA (cytosine1962-C5)-methyltransferase